MSNDVFVVVEHLKGKIGDITFEMLGKAREIADALGGKLNAVLIGDALLAAQLGKADAVLHIGEPMLANFTPIAHKNALAELIRARAPRVVMIANTSMGMDLAASVSVSLDLPLVAYCKNVRVEDGKIIATAQLYGGKLLADAEATGDQVIVSILAGSFSADAGRGAGAPVVEQVSVTTNDGGVRFKQLIEPEAADVDITKQEILVSVGRGIQNADNLPLVEELAAALGGALSASRPIVDNGWLPKSRQVGKSGQTVKPKMYFMVGISGAPEHLEGMRDAGLIIAINTDANAPIFDVAHYGITADLFDVVPALTEKIKSQ
ncbi:MAG: electron transfer flavoprotein subunit alpha/FixB family protein [Chloroflexi bacterium]|nr:electron transfer flavoprotein subunit alpha/FixB family protein [Chloroflexota bacterium]